MSHTRARSRRVLIACLIAAMAFGAAALLLRRGSSSPPARMRAGLEIALQDNAVFLHRYYYERGRAFGEARRLGVTWLRATVLWSRAAGASANRTTRPREVAWQWGAWDDLVRAARRRGVHVELTLTGPAPAWATGDGRLGVVQPSAALFRAFTAAAAAHFRGRVERYSLWNEPNYAAWLTPQGEAPARYRELYSAGYAAVKAADPRAQVLIGETAGPSQPGAVIPALGFLRAVTCRGPGYRPLRHCARLLADGYAHHPYDFANPPEHTYPGPDDVTLGSLDRLTGALDRLAAVGALSTPAGRPLDVYLTEFGYFEHGPRALPASRRAPYLVRAFELAAAHYPRVRQMLQYLLVTPPPGFPGGSFDTAVVTGGGLEETPFTALAAWARSAAARGLVAAPSGAR